MRTLLIFLLINLLNGCVILQPLEPVTNKQINAWVKQNQFDLALHALTARSTIASKKRIRKISTLAEKYDYKKATEVRKKIYSGNWADARKLLNNALSHYSKGKKLISAQKLLQNKRKQHLRQLEAQLLLARAEWLLSKSRIVTQVTHTDPGDALAVRELSSIKSDINNTAIELYKLGTIALAIHELDTADLCLIMADRLRPTAETTTSLARLEDIRHKEKLKRLKKEQQIGRAQLEKNKRLIKESYLAIASNNLIHALGLFSEIRKNKVQKNNILKLERSLTAAVKSKVKSLLETGNNFYSNGNIQKAKSTWGKALRLEPENKLIRERILRADRVIDKLKQLKKENTHENIPR